MKRRALYFTAPRQVEIREEDVPPLEAGEAMVRTRYSAISAGSEMLIYRGEAPEGLAADDKIAALAGALKFPLKYGYAVVGEVVEVGEGVAETWVGREVFAFNPHESVFVARVEEMIPIPEDIPLEEASLLANMETAVNLVMDGQPMLGEGVVVFGQGIVGLLTTALLGEHPLAQLITLDGYASRREASLALGASHSLAAGGADVVEEVRALLRDGRGYEGADLVYELSGRPETLDQAIGVAGFDGRVVVGSWYGVKRANLELGEHFHRNRVQVVSSQVSTLTPVLRGRWSRERRFAVAWEAMGRIGLGRLISHKYALSEAGEAYRMLDERADETLQVVLTYGD